MGLTPAKILVLQLGTKYRDYLSGKKAMIITFRIETPKVNKTKPTSKKASAKKTQVGVQLANRSSAQDVFAQDDDYWGSDEEYTNGDDLIEIDDEVREVRQTRSIRSGLNKRQPSAAAGKSVVPK